MSAYVILTDAGSDLNPELIEAWDVKVTPMGAQVGDTSFLHDPFETQMSYKEFYGRVRNGEHSSTSAVNPDAWAEMIERELTEGRDVLVIPFSSGLSATYDNCSVAVKELLEKYPDRKVLVVDSLSAAPGHGLLVYYAVQKRREGLSIEENAKYLEEFKFKVCHYFTVEDLKYLRRGGRISATTAVVGSALGIKPVLQVDNEGHLVSIGKARGRKASLTALLDNMERLVVEPEKQIVHLGHADCFDEAAALAEEIKRRFGVIDVVLTYVGPIAGGHAGPGTVALFFVGRER